MSRSLLAALFTTLVTFPVWPTPGITLGEPLVGDVVTIEPGSIRIDSLGAGEAVDLRVAATVHPVCFRPILFSLSAAGDGGTFTSVTGPTLNGCAGERSEFDIRIQGDGQVREFDIAFRDGEFDTLVAAIPVELIPLTSDADGDQVPDIADNCVQVANPEQRDSDADDIGNACDPDVALPNDCVVNAADLGVYKLNFFQPGNLDTDNNGDGVTNTTDLGVLRAFFFGPPGPSGLANACTQLGEGQMCDPDASLCGPGLSCCYPCGVPGCDNICVMECDPAEPFCVDGCLAVP